MPLNEQAEAILLLTVSLGKTVPDGPRPLSNKEWARLAAWLRSEGLGPSVLLSQEMPGVLSAWNDARVTVERLTALLGRGAALGLAIESWARAGLWVLTRSDEAYPEKLKRRLGWESPPVLFGCGNKALISGPGIAVVGSRNASNPSLALAREIGDQAAKQGFSIVSGGARGIDQAAMFGALDSEGTSVGILADSLLRLAMSKQYRKLIETGDLVLISPFAPDAGHHVSRLMGRNRYIYCLSEAAIVVTSAADSGGTWTGAVEALRHAWVPLWVSSAPGAGPGNQKLRDMGAPALPDNLGALANLAEEGRSPPSTAAQGERQVAVDSTVRVSSDPATEEPGALGGVKDGSLGVSGAQAINFDLYSLFLGYIGQLPKGKPVSAEHISEVMQLEKSQVSAWLKRATSEGWIKKLKNPVRYLAQEPSKQGALF